MAAGYQPAVRQLLLHMVKKAARAATMASATDNTRNRLRMV